jgi:hypothetical protein
LEAPIHVNVSIAIQTRLTEGKLETFGWFKEEYNKVKDSLEFKQELVENQKELELKHTITLGSLKPSCLDRLEPCKCINCQNKKKEKPNQLPSS